ncbi:MAG TPA: hypothetical protein EYP14_04730, partial [Planctomycetaceae bacterium]|nr:hypothetical protein [Planctomycetaceae bacterium]
MKSGWLSSGRFCCGEVSVVREASSRWPAVAPVAVFVWTLAWGAPLQGQRFADGRFVGGSATTLQAGALGAERWSEPAANVIRNGGFEAGLDHWSAAEQHELVRDPRQARSGNSCLSGEVTKPKQFLRLVQNVTVRKGYRYEFEAWARATNRTKLVLWILAPGAERRSLVAAWQNLPRKWRRCKATIDVQRSGTLRLELIAPSSVGAPAGRIWLDDIALYEYPSPELTRVSDEGFNDCRLWP